MKKSALIIIFAFILFFCPESKKEKLNKTEIADYVWTFAQQQPDGFTLNILTLKPVTKGFVVSYFETQNSFGRESLTRVIEHSLNHEAVVGGWPKNDSLYYFDSNKIFPDEELASAIAFGIENKQDAIYDLTNNREIDINDSTNSCNSVSKQFSTSSMTY